MESNKDKKDILYRLYFVISSTELIIQKYDEIKIEGYNKKIYSKNFGREIKSSIRIVTEIIDDHEEIKSIHFQKNKKTT